MSNAAKNTGAKNAIDCPPSVCIVGPSVPSVAAKASAEPKRIAAMTSPASLTDGRV